MDAQTVGRIGPDVVDADDLGQPYFLGACRCALFDERIAEHPEEQAVAVRKRWTVVGVFVADRPDRR